MSFQWPEFHIPVTSRFHLAAAMVILLPSGTLAAPGSGADAQEDIPFTRLFDTGAPAEKRLGDGLITARSGWQLVAEDKLDHKFTGEVVIGNDKLAVVFRKGGPGAEVYSKMAKGLRYRATVGHFGVGVSSPGNVDRVNVIENTSSAVVLEIGYRSTTGPLRFRLTAGEGILETRSDDTNSAVSVHTNTRYVVVPDYFADDVVYAAESARGSILPAENFCLHLLEGGEAILMEVWQSSQQYASFSSGGPEQSGGSYSTTIPCVKGKATWLAFLEGTKIWEARSVSTLGEWQAPFAAKWRASLITGASTAESWDMGVDEPAGSEKQRQGPAIVYPIDRSTATPLTATCPTDVMRNTLGVGPCQYILACEGMGAEGDPTPNSVMSWVEKQFEANKQRKAADDIRERLDFMTAHIEHARQRIQRYAEFGRGARKLLADKAGADSLKGILDDLERFSTAALGPGAATPVARQWATEVLALVTQDNGLVACQRLGQQLRSLGAVQDRALAKSRMAVRRLRQQARMLAAAKGQQSELGRQAQQMAEECLEAK